MDIITKLAGIEGYLPVRGSVGSAYSSVLKPANRSARLVVVLVTGGSS